MKLQIALDLIDLPEAKDLVAKVADVVDIIEVGTPLVIKEGIKAVTEIKQSFPRLEVLADLKIMDAGDLEAKIALEAGADIVTVLGAAHDATIQGALDQAWAFGKAVLADLIAVDRVAKRAQELDDMGVDLVCVHTAYDVQDTGLDPVRELESVRPVLKRAGLAVAGGIKPETISQVAAFQPEIVIVGGFIMGHPDPRRAVLELRGSLAG